MSNLEWTAWDEARTFGVVKVCTICKVSFDGTETAYLTYNDVFNNEDTYHVGCWNKSVFGEVAR